MTTRDLQRSASGPWPPHWSEHPCACGKPLATPDPAQRLCPDCWESVLEGLAVALEPSWDAGVMHDGEELWAVLSRLYGSPWLP